MRKFILWCIETCLSGYIGRRKINVFKSENKVIVKWAKQMHSFDSKLILYLERPENTFEM